LRIAAAIHLTHLNSAMNRVLAICLLCAVTAGPTLGRRPAAPNTGIIQGTVRHPGGLLPLPKARLLLRNLTNNSIETIVTDARQARS